MTKKRAIDKRCRVAVIAVSLQIALAGGVHALTVDESPVGGPAVLADPWLPPGSRKPAGPPPATGKALRAEVERKLRQQFEAADASGAGITRAQAAAAGLGYVERHFDQIDTSQSGRIRFDDVKRFMKQRGATLD